jgi:hypothetical protein
MFGLFKRAAARSTARLLLADTISAMQVAPLADQVSVAAALVPQIEGLISACRSLRDPQVLVQQELGTATARRHMALANGATHSAAPDWAEAALLESWCIAATTGLAELEHATLAIGEWSASVGFPLRVPSRDTTDGARVEPQSTHCTGNRGTGVAAAEASTSTETPGVATPAGRVARTVRTVADLHALAQRMGGTVTFSTPHADAAAKPSRFGCHKCGKVKELDAELDCSRMTCPARALLHK